MASVATKSAWLSKINWTQAVGVVASVLVFASGGHYSIPAEQQAQLVLAIQGAQAFLTWVFRTWFTSSLTPASIGK